MYEYESPIKLIMDRMAADIAERTDQNTWQAVQRVGVDVDKDELIRALKYDRGQYKKGYNDGYEDGLNADKWISVEDRLPDDKTNPVTLDFNEVICFCDFGGDPKRTDVRTYNFGTRLGDTRPHFWHGPQIMDGVVTHWQYLPEPPKEET